MRRENPLLVDRRVHAELQGSDPNLASFIRATALGPLPFLAHSNLFRAGIARSGAYNRTLTPFSFQAEERTFWEEASDTYMKMSPFTYAQNIKTPLLMIHGMDDNNTGTFPIQSERLYGALKGLGATVRMVMLPYESHGYRAGESVMHMLWEMDTWMDRHVKNAAAK